MPNTTQGTPAAGEAAPTPGQPVRSEGLLAADDDNPDLQVAEEVAFDLQSDEARRIGALPADTPAAKPADALAESLRPDGESGEASPGKQGGQALRDAVDGAVPPSP